MKTRNHDYLDTVTGNPVYSFQVKHNNTWHNVHDNGKPLLFETEEARNIERDKISKVKPS